jgi:hypothetical protein
MLMESLMESAAELARAGASKREGRESQSGSAGR